MNYEQLLLTFKQKENESQESVVPLMDDKDLRNGIAAWQSVIIKKDNSSENCPYDIPSEQWEWMWKDIKFDVSMFGIVSGVSEHLVTKLFLRLKGLRLIYPDGSVNSLAKQYLQGVAAGKLPTTVLKQNQKKEKDNGA